MAGKPNQAAADVVKFNTELLSLDLHNLNGHTFAIPLGRANGGGYQNVESLVNITLSAMHPSKGMAVACPPVGMELNCQPVPNPPPINPNALNGQRFQVDSFFDVFFDVKFTDVDPAHPLYASGTDVLAAMGVGPAKMEANYFAIFDKNAPNFGLIPPPASGFYTGHLKLEIPLGFDVDGNGENDKIKFTVAEHATVDGSKTFIILPDGTVIDKFDSNAALDGAVVDVSRDPPFTIGMFGGGPGGGPTPGFFGGSTTASSKLVNSIVPEPSTIVLLGLGAGILAFGRKRWLRR